MLRSILNPSQFVVDKLLDGVFLYVYYWRIADVVLCCVVNHNEFGNSDYGCEETLIFKMEILFLGIYIFLDLRRRCFIYGYDFN